MTGKTSAVVFLLYLFDSLQLSVVCASKQEQSEYQGRGGGNLTNKRKYSCIYIYIATTYML